jgi:two-component system chemotaxis response regulator CheB
MSSNSHEAIGVLVVDDSALMRNLITRIVDAEPDLAVVGTAMNGDFALKKLSKLQPDCIVLDIEMPVMNGIEFLKARRDQGIDIPVVILSSVATKGARVTMEALSLGAVDFITKPSGSVSHDIHVVGEQLTALIRGFGGKYRDARGITPPTPPPDHAIRLPARTERAPRATKEQPPTRTPERSPGPVEVIAIGISTGGPNALRRVFAEIDSDIGVPVLVVQHMPAGFTTEFALSLDRVSPLEIKEASDGDILVPNRVLIAPGNRHMAVEKKKLASVVRLSDGDPVNGHRPSADVLFRSVAEAYGHNALAVIMTGMGRDGAREIGLVYEAGGVTIAQDEASSVVYGMPRIAVEYGYVSRQASLEEIPQLLSSYAKELAR